jgi:hypothetical protein
MRSRLRVTVCHGDMITQIRRTAIPMSTIATVCSVILDCPESNPSDPCRIPLPLQIPIRRCEDLQSLPMGTWPAIFLCLRHGHACVRWPHNVHLEHEALALGQRIPSLWRIECVCAHESCGRRHAIYTARARELARILELIAIYAPEVACDGHALVWREGLMSGTEFPHNSPVR